MMTNSNYTMAALLLVFSTIILTRKDFDFLILFLIITIIIIIIYYDYDSKVNFFND
jgi:hypothetical protein